MLRRTPETAAAVAAQLRASESLVHNRMSLQQKLLVALVSPLLFPRTSGVCVCLAFYFFDDTNGFNVPNHESNSRLTSSGASKLVHAIFTRFKSSAVRRMVETHK